MSQSYFSLQNHMKMISIYPTLESSINLSGKKLHMRFLITRILRNQHMRCLTSKHSSFHLNFISGWKNYCAYNFYAFKTHYICSCNIKSFVCLGVQKKISKRAAFLRFAFCFDFSSVFDHNVKFYRYIKDLLRLKCKM